jgi:predicted nuclease of restriction endonuclease-like (RecB) superfamily
MTLKDKKTESNGIVSTVSTESLIQDLRQIIDGARSRVAAQVNSELTLMYWHIGERINREVLGNERAEYGKQIVATVAQQLQMEYGTKGFDEKSIRRMMRFAVIFPDIQIVAPLARKLSFSHFQEVMCLKDKLQREFYLTLAASERWSKRQLREKIDGMLFERTAISAKPEELIKKELSELRDKDVVSPDLVFKSPYFLEFTGLKSMYSEKSLEDCLVVNLEQFMNEMEPGEETPMGLLLCTEGGEEQIELLQLDKSGIKVAQYLTELPPRHVLMNQIQKTMEAAKAHFDNLCDD